MLYPSIDSLMEKIDSKYSLVTLSSKRAREIQQYDNQQITKPVSHKFVGKALEEIQSGILTKVGETPED
ncbi:DNA-directed RNA polymerase subunit omega [Fictibacillus sp. b24]|uniref:DNA-directed RNA polymerase subunit omega n=1 Tax=unclassified Fictibacillus TaxID=2644029 RepID=UPI0025A1CD3D|nr:DNA-directed RNA polymerase subunit omega [Fictibacillus sp. b24]MDM5316591.1 DNA-directed RNA polymerase subunit omega [Fictibacillus sp. b24]